MFVTDISNMKRALENQERKDQNPVEERKNDIKTQFTKREKKSKWHLNIRKQNYT